MPGPEESGNGGAMWELTGNHSLALPFIAASDGAIHQANVLQRRRNALLSWTAAPEPAADGDALLRVAMTVNGNRETLTAVRWERLDRWVPRLHASTSSGLRVALTICAPGGYDPIVPGGLVHVEVDGAVEGSVVGVAFEGVWRWSLATLASTRPTSAVHRLVCSRSGQALALEIDDAPHGAAIAFSGGPGASVAVAKADESLRSMVAGSEAAVPNGTAFRYRIEKAIEVRAGRRATAALSIGLAPERDGAFAVVAWLDRLGAAELIRLGRLELARIGRSADTALRDVVGRNLAFHHYSSVARAIDDDRLYPVLSRSPGHGACAVFAERAALAWSLPAHAITDPSLARELYIRILEQYSDRPGRSRRYLDGGALSPGFSLGNACEYALALERYVDGARDESLLDDPLVRQVLRELDDLVWHRLHPEIFLAETEVLASGDAADYPYASFDNVLLWRFCKMLGRLSPPAEGDPPLRMAGAEEEVAAAFWQRCTADVDGFHVIVGSTDAKRDVAIYDDPSGSLGLLPFLGFCEADDPIWANTMDLLHSKRYPLWLGSAARPGLSGRSRPGEASMAALCADLLGPRRAEALDTLRTLDLPGGVACETWDPATGRAMSGPWAAAEAGFLMWALLEEPRPDHAARRAR